MTLTIGYYAMKYGFLVIGTLMMILAYFIRRSEKKKHSRCTLPVKGIVSDMVRRSDMNTSTVTRSYWYPEFEYEVQGEQVFVLSSFGREHNRFKIGQNVNLLVNPENIREYYCKEENTERTAGIVMAAGLGAVVIGLVIVYILHS